MELPKTCDYWKWTVVQAFIKKHCLQSCLCDGCMLGIVDDDGRPLRKSWQIMSTLPLSGLNGRTCDGTHEHGQSRGYNLKHAESYSYHMTDAIHRDWKQHVAKTASRVTPSRSFALCCLLCRSQAWPLPPREPGPSVRTLCGARSSQKSSRQVVATQSSKRRSGPLNPQTALAASIDHARLPGLSRLSTIANSGLSEIQPDASRGRVRYLVLVTDSFSVFLAGKNTGVDLAGDLVEQVAKGVMSQYTAVSYKPLWGKTLPILVAQARDAVDELWEGIKNESCCRLARQRVGGREGAVPESCLRILERKIPWTTLCSRRLARNRRSCLHEHWRTSRPSGQAGCWQCRGCDHDAGPAGPEEVPTSAPVRRVHEEVFRLCPVPRNEDDFCQSHSGFNPYV